MTVTATKPVASAEAEIRTLITNWSRALERKDLAGLTANYAPDAVLYDLKPPYKVQGPEAIRALWESCLPYFPESFKAEHVDLEITATEDLAYVFGLHRLIMPGSPSHPANNFHCRITVCYKKLNNRWVVAHEHVSVPYNSMTGKVVPITDPNDLSCPFEGCDGSSCK